MTIKVGTIEVFLSHLNQAGNFHCNNKKKIFNQMWAEDAVDLNVKAEKGLLDEPDDGHLHSLSPTAVGIY